MHVGDINRTFRRPRDVVGYRTGSRRHRPSQAEAGPHRNRKTCPRLR